MIVISSSAALAGDHASASNPIVTTSFDPGTVPVSRYQVDMSDLQPRGALDSEGRTGPIERSFNAFNKAPRLMKINGNEIRPGNVIQHKGGLWVAVKTNHVKPGKGPAYAQVELKHVIEGTKLNERFRASENVERVRLEQNDYQYLYEEDDNLVFMHQENYEQITIPKDMIGERAAFLQDGMTVVVESFEEMNIGVALPDQVTLEVTETEAVVKGQTASSS